MERKVLAWSPEEFDSLGALARQSGYPPDAFRFVIDVVVLNGTMSTSNIGKQLRRHAEATFGDEAKAVLNSWNIRRSEDVGLIVDGLVRERILVSEADDSLADFDGRFTVEELFENT